MISSAVYSPTSILSIVQTILEENRALELTSRDIALLVLMRQEIESVDETVLGIPYLHNPKHYTADWMQ